MSLITLNKTATTTLDVTTLRHPNAHPSLEPLFSARAELTTRFDEAEQSLRQARAETHDADEILAGRARQRLGFIEAEFLDAKEALVSLAPQIEAAQDAVRHEMRRALGKKLVPELTAFLVELAPVCTRQVRLAALLTQLTRVGGRDFIGVLDGWLPSRMQQIETLIARLTH